MVAGWPEVRQRWEDVLVDVAQKTMAYVGRGDLWKFWGWMDGGRFGVFTYHNQYGNKVTIVFDTQRWEVILRTECEDCSSSDKVMKPSGELPVAASPLAPELLMTNGTVINLLISRSTRPLVLLGRERHRRIRTTPHGLVADRQVYRCGGMRRCWLRHLFGKRGWLPYASAGIFGYVRLSAVAELGGG